MTSIGPKNTRIMTIERGWLDKESGAEWFTLLRGASGTGNPYQGDSVCGYTGDDESHYMKCRSALALRLGVDECNLVQPRQSHTSNVLFLDDEFFSKDDNFRCECLQDVDGIVTCRRDAAIGVNTADCVPVLLCAGGSVPMVAAIHAGWRGTVAGIVSNAVDCMVAHGASVNGMSAYVGVSICGKCYEVGDEVADMFAGAGLGGKEIISRNKITGKAHVNLKEANRVLLVRAGLDWDRITVNEECSFELTDKYYSARRMGVNSGRTFTGIILHG